MDATSPFRRWLCSAGLLCAALGGCHTPGSNSTDAAPVRSQSTANPSATVSQSQTIATTADASAGGAAVKARPQSPVDHSSAAPAGVVPPSGVVTGAPLSPPPTVVGEAVGSGGTVQASYAAKALNAPRLILPEGKPRLKQLAIVGIDNFVSEDEIWEAVRQRGPEYLRKVDGRNGPQIVTDTVKEKEIFEQELRRAIERELILDDMYDRLKKAKKLEAIRSIEEYSEKATDQQLQDVKSRRFRVRSDKDFNIILSAQGLTLAGLRRQIQRQMMADEYIRSMFKEKGRAIGFSDVREYYETHADEFRTKDRVKWLDIFINFHKFPSPRDAYNQAVQVQKLAASGADFAALSKQYDQGLAGQQGGEGIGQLRGEIQPVDVEATLWELKPGQVSGLIQTPVGYHIVKVVEREVAVLKPFSIRIQMQIRNKLQVKLHEEERRKLVEELWWRGRFKILNTTPQ